MADLTTISYGAGTQSSVLMLLAAAGEVEPMPDMAIFADTGNEPPAVYEMVEWMTDQVPFPLVQVSAMRPILQAFRDGTDGRGYAIGHPIPAHTIDTETGKAGMSRRSCTRDFKLSPMRSVIRAHLGVEYHCPVPPGVEVETWVGISLDEIIRMKPSRDKWQRNRWPLVELAMTRGDCHGWWAENAPVGAPDKLPRSSCVICPFHSAPAWRGFAETAPEMIEDAARAEEEFQATQIERGRARVVPFIHRRRIPLREAVAADVAEGDMPSMLEIDLDDFGSECEGMCGV